MFVLRERKIFFFFFKSAPSRKTKQKSWNPHANQSYARRHAFPLQQRLAATKVDDGRSATPFIQIKPPLRSAQNLHPTPGSQTSRSHHSNTTPVPWLTNRIDPPMLPNQSWQSDISFFFFLSPPPGGGTFPHRPFLTSTDPLCAKISSSFAGTLFLFTARDGEARWWMGHGHYQHSSLPESMSSSSSWYISSSSPSST